MAYEVIATSTSEKGLAISGSEVVVLFTGSNEQECADFIASVSVGQSVWPFAGWEPSVDGTLTTREAS